MGIINIEKIIYDNEREFIHDLHFKWRDPSIDSIDIGKIIEHEKCHFELAKERGYDPKYSVKRITVNLLIGLLSNISYQVRVENVNPDDLRDICLAPEDPSKSDIFMASKFYQVPYSIYWKMMDR